MPTGQNVLYLLLIFQFSSNYTFYYQEPYGWKSLFPLMAASYKHLVIVVTFSKTHLVY